MAQIEIQLPSIFAPIVGEALQFSLQAHTLAHAFEALRITRNDVALHLFDESGALRPHVLCFHNGVNSRWIAASDVQLRDGDMLLFMQAVSGG